MMNKENKGKKEKLATKATDSNRMLKLFKITAFGILRNILELLYKWNNEDPFTSFEAFSNRNNRNNKNGKNNKNQNEFLI